MSRLKDGVPYRLLLLPVIQTSETTVAILKSISTAGATCCELGVPYSDPIADGAVIQSSYTRALNAGMNLEKMFSIVSEDFVKHAKCPCWQWQVIPLYFEAELKHS